jgi:hypothetical protein
VETISNARSEINAGRFRTKAEVLHDRTRKPPALPVIPEDIPAELRGRPQWACWGWRWKDDAKKPENSQWGKKPFRADGRGLAATDDPATWATFDAALAAYRASDGTLDGLFYTFTAGDPFCGGDMDSCRDPTNGTLDPKPVAEVTAWATYAEVSPTGTGIKLTGKGMMPGGGGRKSGDYEAYSQGRFWAMTGHRLPDAPAAVNECQAALDTFVARYIGTPKAEPKPSQPRANTSNDLSDDELLARIRRSDQAALFCTLYDCGDTSEYKSHSEADLALCGILAFWTGGDADRMDRLFRASKLYRDKWDRKDYRNGTIAKALEGKTEFYTPGGQHTSNGKANEQTHTGTPAGPADVEHLTDVGNARRVVARHRADLRYAFPWKQFLIWDGRGWRPDETGAAPMRSNFSRGSVARREDPGPRVVSYAGAAGGGESAGCPGSATPAGAAGRTAARRPGRTRTGGPHEPPAPGWSVSAARRSAAAASAGPPSPGAWRTPRTAPGIRAAPGTGRTRRATATA